MKEETMDAQKAQLKLLKIQTALTAGILVLLLATLVGYAFCALGFTEANIITVYILGVLVVSVITTNSLCSLFASIVSVLVFNFFFTSLKLRFYKTNHFVKFRF